MNKKGQFFIVATFIIVTIIFSFGVVYNSAKSESSYSEDVSSLANSIMYESFQLINNGIYNGTGEKNITDSLLNLTYFYSMSSPTFNISIIYSNQPGFGAKQYFDGDIVELTPTNTSNDITLNLNNANYTFNMTQGYNFHVVIIKETKDERFIAAK
ncbi:MAG: hypothetical protein AABX85_02360 [Nanoarchaeota archaeon]